MLTADAIATSDGYALSRGARLELSISRRLGMPEFSASAWLGRTEFNARIDAARAAKDAACTSSS